SRVSTSVLAAHRDEASGAIIASLSIPWGSSTGDDDLGGYHLVWPRDLVETAGGLAAAGLPLPARALLSSLPAAPAGGLVPAGLPLPGRVVLSCPAAVQEGDGPWPQNMWLDGTAYWGGVQL